MTSPELSRLVKYGDAKSEDEGRAYSYPLIKDENGKYPQYPSVTTVLRMVNHDSLIGWATGLVADWCVNNLDLLQRSSIERGINMARYRHNAFRDERASVGDGVHAAIEAEHTGSWAFPQLNDEQQAIMEQWRQFCSEHEVKPMYSELTMFNRQVEYAGTADGVWWIDGKLSLIDVKTSRSTWPEHFMQLAALKYCTEWVPKIGDHWESIKPLPIEQLAIVHLRSDLHNLIILEDELVDPAWWSFQGYRMAWDGQRIRKEFEKKKYGEF